MLPMNDRRCITEITSSTIDLMTILRRASRIPEYTVLDCERRSMNGDALRPQLAERRNRVREDRPYE